MNQRAEVKDDDFEAAFSQFSYPGDNEESDFKPVSEDDEPVSAEAEEPEAEAEEAEAEAAEAEEEEVEEPEEGDEEPEAAEAEEPEEEPEPESKEETTDDLLERFAKIVKESSKEEKEEPKRQEPEQQQQEQPELYTDEEKQLLEEYEKEWPEVSRAESLRRRAEYRELVGYVFQQIAAELKPMMETVQTVAERTHYNDLQQAVGDYDDVRDDVVAWVEEQPEYLQQAYKHVINQGTVDEVSDLIERFKRETGRNAPAEPAKKKEAELPKTAKKAAESLAPVSSKRTAPPEPDDPNDFGSAFAKFAEELK